ncbi:NPC intracellular cholesterol transporter 2 homolog a-like [Dysidea avara]|uniref:NPC intracellular cholesterol transporter 2 homolog a-like n=1 Tax=Dysidea avara TaxID=196820 RepID=UPI0033204CCC
MKLFYAVALLFSAVFVTQAVMFKDCGSVSCKINSVDVRGCAENAQTCDVVKGQTVNMTLKFTTSSEMKDLKNSVEGLVGGTWVQFKMEDACSNTTPACPVPTDATYIFSLTISKLYPEISVVAKSNMTDDSGAVCTCFEIQVKIV